MAGVCSAVLAEENRLEGKPGFGGGKIMGYQQEKQGKYNKFKNLNELYEYMDHAGVHFFEVLDTRKGYK